MADAGSTSSSGAEQKPINKTRQALAQSRGWLIAEQFPRFGNIRTSQRHVAGLLGQLVDFCPFPEGVLDRRDQIFELNRLALAKVEHVEQRAFVLERSHRSLNHVINVSVIAARSAVPKLIDRLPGVNTTGELMNGQIRALARTVNGEIPKRDYTQVVEMRVGRAKKFACDLCGSIRTQCLGKMYILRKWDRLRSSVNR